MRGWDPEQRYPGINADYCRTTCGGKRCPECPAPTLLPESQPGYAAYLACSTQWRVGHSGRTGLDYTACYSLLDRRLPTWKETAGDAFAEATVDSLMTDIQIVEFSTLRADAHRREQDKAQREKG